MKTFASIEEAQLARPGNPDARCVVEIEHAIEGRRFILAKVGFSVLQANLSRLPEISRLVAEHPLRTPEEQEAENRRIEKEMRDNTCCERCGEHVDPDATYKQQEWTRFGGKKVRVTAWYCGMCERLLEGIGAGEVTAMEERAGNVPSPEPRHPQDY